MNPTAPSHGPALRVLEADVVGLGPEETQASVAEAALARASKRLLSLQEPQGWWHPLEENTLGDVIEITLEFVMHLDTLIGALASRSALAS